MTKRRRSQSSFILKPMFGQHLLLRKRSPILWFTLLNCLLAFFSVFAYSQDNITQSSIAQGSNTPTVELTVIDPYAELRTGPGRGYPVFYAIEQGENIEVLTRRPGWYEVRSANGNTGWTSTAELSRTMQASGAPADLPSVGYGDYLKRSFRTGLRTGQFSSGEMEGSDSFSATGGYRFYSWLGAELELGKIFGNDVRGRYYGFNVLLEPLSHWRLSPFVTLGTGSMNIDSQPKLVPLNIEKSDFDTYSLGAHYYVGRNFVIEANYRWYSVDSDSDSNTSSNNTEKLEAWNIGFSAFF